MNCTPCDFDRVIDRRGTGAVKTDTLTEHFGREDVIPLWVADMDFCTPDCVLQAIRSRCDHPVLGYTKPTDGYYEAIIEWIGRRHNWHIEREEIGFVSGIVPGLAFCIKAFTRVGDKILIQSPVYPPFHNLPRNSDREVVTNPLQLIDGRFEIDFDDFEQKLTGVKLFILCNPHNPGGRVWSREELIRLAEICHRHHVLVISDEIHSDLILFGHQHTPFASVSDHARYNSVTLMAPSKTFNMAGLSSSYHLIFNKEIKHRLDDYLQGSELANGHLFAFCAAEAAYRHGHEWLCAALDYIEKNIEYVTRFLNTHIPGVNVMKPEASFLLWLDCRELGMEHEELTRFMINEARIALNDGLLFGKEGRGFLRLNVGSPRTTLMQAMQQLHAAMQKKDRLT